MSHKSYILLKSGAQLNINRLWEHKRDWNLIGADFRNLLKSKQAEQKVPDFGILPSVQGR